MIGKLFKGLVEGAATPVARVMEKKEETKQVLAEIKSKTGLSDHALNMLRTEKKEKSWVDEYISVWGTVGITILAYFVFADGGVDAVIKLLNVPIIQWGLGAIIVAGLGVKAFRGIGR